MSSSGGQIGNKNAARGNRWRIAIETALEERSAALRTDALRALAVKLLDLCDAGDLGALKELGDRLDGKPKQQIEGTLTGAIELTLAKDDAEL